MADVYSFAIILQELITLEKPFSSTHLTPGGTTFANNNCIFNIYITTTKNSKNAEIIKKLRLPPPLLRPSVSKGMAHPELIDLMKQCWAENPYHRPKCTEIWSTIKKFNNGR